MSLTEIQKNKARESISYSLVSPAVSWVIISSIGRSNESRERKTRSRRASRKMKLGFEEKWVADCVVRVSL